MSTKENNKKALIAVGVLLLIVFYLGLEQLVHQRLMSQAVESQLKPLNKEESCTAFIEDLDKLGECYLKQQEKIAKEYGYPSPQKHTDLQFKALINNEEKIVVTTVIEDKIKINRVESFSLDFCNFSSPATTYSLEDIKMVSLEPKEQFVLCYDEGLRNEVIYYSLDWDLNKLKERVSFIKAQLVRAPKPGQVPTNKAFIDPSRAHEEALKETMEKEKSQEPLNSEE